MKSQLLSNATDLLLGMHCPDRHMFSYSTRVEGCGYRNNFDDPGALRYSTVALLGLNRALPVLGQSEQFFPLLDGFVKAHWHEIESLGDLGVLCSVVSRVRHPLAGVMLKALENRCVRDELIASLTAQEICQLLIALCEMHANGESTRCEALAQKVWRCLRSRFICETTGFCFHKTAWHRRNFISFGGITYYLRALHDFGKVFGEVTASRLFDVVLTQVVALQGPRGEWPWYIDARSGQVAEWYEVYSVHQHAMAFLFLFPGLAEGREALALPIRKSYQWILGNNELELPMIQMEPFFIYRSIRRKESQAQLRRLLRATTSSWFGSRASFAPADSLEINTECRSYEIGWLLCVWADQQMFQDFHAIEGAPQRHARAT